MLLLIQLLLQRLVLLALMVLRKRRRQVRQRRWNLMEGFLVEIGLEVKMKTQMKMELLVMHLKQEELVAM